MSRALETFDEVWERLKAEDKTGIYEKAEVLAFITEDALEYAYNNGYATAKAEFERPHGEWIIVKDERWGDNVKCPFCGKELAGTDLNFCCKCGADMRGAKNE